MGDHRARPGRLTLTSLTSLTTDTWPLIPSMQWPTACSDQVPRQGRRRWAWLLVRTDPRPQWISPLKSGRRSSGPMRKNAVSINLHSDFDLVVECFFNFIHKHADLVCDLVTDLLSHQPCLWLSMWVSDSVTQWVWCRTWTLVPRGIRKMFTVVIVNKSYSTKVKSVGQACSCQAIKNSHKFCRETSQTLFSIPSSEGTMD